MGLSDLITLILVGTVLLLLGIAMTAINVLRRRDHTGLDAAMIETFRLRVRGWLMLFSILGAAFLIGQWATVVLFGLTSFWALREFITLTPTRPGDHRALFWVFFLFTPLQFVLVGLGKLDLLGVVIPVYGLLFIPARIAMAGDYKRFLERVAKIQAGLLICVYCFSHAPALLKLPIPVPKEGEWSPSPNALLFFFVLIVQLSDALQYAWAQLPSKHVIAPTINPGKTWEGLLGGTLSVTLLGAALWFATPFRGGYWWMAALTAMICSLLGFAGSLTMSAIKRDRGVKDYGTLVEGHGGVLDRLDSLCFAAPVFYHITLLWLQR